jgi:hypothetical protein
LLKISILLNLALIGYVMVILQRSRTTRVEVVSPAAKENTAAESSLTAVTATVLESKTFNWSQVESADYRTYIANLRGIGCPERTIRDIITADVDSMYAERREELRHRQQAQSKGALAESLSRRSLDSGLKELADEENRLLKILLEPEGSDMPTIPERVAKLRIERMRQKPVSMPLAMENVDLAELNLNEDQLRLVTQLRDNFVKEIGGYNQDPNDPAYRERWQKAQAQSDEVLHAMLGNRAYQDYQLLVPGKSTPAATQP